MLRPPTPSRGKEGPWLAEVTQGHSVTTCSGRTKAQPPRTSPGRGHRVSTEKTLRPIAPLRLRGHTSRMAGKF